MMMMVSSDEGSTKRILKINLQNKRLLSTKNLDVAGGGGGDADSWSWCHH